MSRKSYTKGIPPLFIRDVGKEDWFKDVANAPAEQGDDTTTALMTKQNEPVEKQKKDLDRALDKILKNSWLDILKGQAEIGKRRTMFRDKLGELPFITLGKWLPTGNPLINFKVKGDDKDLGAINFERPYSGEWNIFFPGQSEAENFEQIDEEPRAVLVLAGEILCDKLLSDESRDRFEQIEGQST